MNTKLTLKLDKRIIMRAKRYALKNHTSISGIVENYLNTLTSGAGSEEDITPLVKSLIGVIDLPENYDYKKDYVEHLSKKYR